MVYSGKADACQTYFSNIGWACPPGFNIADYLSASSSLFFKQRPDHSTVDLTMQNDSPSIPLEAEATLIQLEGEQDTIAVSDPELGVRRARAIVTPSSTSDETELETRPSTANGNGSTLSAAKRLFSSGRNSPVSPGLSERLARLVEAYEGSAMALEVKEEIEKARSEAREDGSVEGEQVVLRAYKRAGWWTQFTILSGRSFKNLYRNPMLMLSHYVVSVLVACESVSRKGGLGLMRFFDRHLRLPLPRIDVRYRSLIECSS